MYVRHKLNRKKTAERVSECIERSRMPISKIASAAGVSEQTVRGYMRGKSVPRMGTLFGIAHEIGVYADDLLAFDRYEV